MVDHATSSIAKEQQTREVSVTERRRSFRWWSFLPFFLAAGFLSLLVAGGTWLAIALRDPLREAKDALEKGDLLVSARLAEAWLNSQQVSVDGAKLEGGKKKGSEGRGPLSKRRIQEAMLIAARAYARMGQFEKAEAYFAMVPLTEKQDLYARAGGLVHRKLYAEAAFVYEQVIQRWPDEGSALDRLIRIRLQQDRRQEAVVMAQRLRTLPGWEVTGNILYGLLLFEERQVPEALKALEAALEAQPDLAPAKTRVDKDVVLSVYAECLHVMGRIEEAIKAASQARDLSAKNPDPCYILGLCYSQKGQLQLAKQYLEEAVARDPTHLRSLLELGRIALMLKQPKEARHWFETALKMDPGDKGALQGLVTALRLEGRTSEAEALQKSIKQ
jgi:predicted Zn-dependent protease